MKVIRVVAAYRGERLPFIEEVTEPRLGEALRARYPWFKPSYSKTVRSAYYGNCCPKCDALQGHFYATEDAIGVAMDGEDVEEDLPWELREIEPGWTETHMRKWGHLHHEDGNPTNNAVENLRLLCVRCHRSRHTGE